MKTKSRDDNGRLKAEKPTATSRKLTELSKQRQGDLPIWIRAPIRGPEKFTGLTRPYLYSLESQGLIISRSITQPGKVRGCRLFHLPSILAFIEKSGAQEVAK